MNYGIEYSSFCDEDFNLIRYCDTDFANDMNNRKFTPGYVFKVSIGSVTWSSNKQYIVST